MNIEKRNQKMLATIAVLVLVGILITISIGFMMQERSPSLKDNEMGGITNPITNPESFQTSPTGELVMSIGIILLIIGFGVIVVMLWARRNRLHHPSQ